MKMTVSDKVEPKQIPFEEAIDSTGFGKYNVWMLVSCCLLILAMYIDMFGFSVALPAVACDMQLTTTQQGLLSAMPLIGVMISSYGWGLCADTAGRRKTLLVAMPVGAALNLAASLAPTYSSLAALKFFSASFTSSANAAAFVLVGESTPRRHRGRLMFIMASATMLSQITISAVAIPVFQETFQVPIAWLSLVYRPWRLLLQIISLPGVMGCFGIIFSCESPKFLLSKNREREAIDVLRTIYKCNSGRPKDDYSVASVYLDEQIQSDNTDKPILRKIWDQTAPLFKPPLLRNSLKLYYLLLCAYMTSTGFTMWVPTMTNAYFDGEESTGHTFCEVASKAARINSTLVVPSDCNDVIQPVTLYAVMCYSGTAAVLTILLSFIAKPYGKRRTTLLVFAISSLCGATLLFITTPLLSISLFYMFLYTAIILGNVNTYLVELNPTHLRGMATSLSVVVARGFGFFSVQLIATLLGDHCTPMIIGYVVLVISGSVVSYFLPRDEKEVKTTDATEVIS